MEDGIDDIKVQFLNEYARIRCFNTAARLVGKKPSTIRKWRKDDPDFDAEVLEAEEDYAERIHETANLLAIEGVVEKKFDREGNVTSTKRVYATNVLLRLMEAYMPDRFRPRSEVAGIPGGAPIDLNDATAAARLAGILDNAAKRKEAGEEPDPFS